MLPESNIIAPLESISTVIIVAISHHRRRTAPLVIVVVFVLVVFVLTVVIVVIAVAAAAAAVVVVCSGKLAELMRGGNSSGVNLGTPGQRPASEHAPERVPWRPGSSGKVMRNTSSNTLNMLSTPQRFKTRSNAQCSHGQTSMSLEAVHAEEEGSLNQPNAQTPVLSRSLRVCARTTPALLPHRSRHYDNNVNNDNINKFNKLDKFNNDTTTTTTTTNDTTTNDTTTIH